MSADNQLKRIKTPALGQGYGENIQKTFNDIDDNFGVLSNRDFMKGDTGTSLISRNIPLKYIYKWDNNNFVPYTNEYPIVIDEQNYYVDSSKILNELKNSFKTLKRELLGLDSTIEDTDPDIIFTLQSLSDVNNNYSILFNFILPNNPEDYLIIKSIIPLIYIDQRFWLNTALSNVSVDLSSTINCTYNEDTQKNNWSCIQNFPSLYYNPESDSENSIYWLINGTRTSIPARGPKGLDGSAGEVLVGLTETPVSRWPTTVETRPIDIDYILDTGDGSWKSAGSFISQHYPSGINEKIPIIVLPPRQDALDDDDSTQNQYTYFIGYLDAGTGSNPTVQINYNNIMYVKMTEYLFKAVMANRMVVDDSEITYPTGSLDNYLKGYTIRDDATDAGNKKGYIVYASAASGGDKKFSVARISDIESFNPATDASDEEEYDLQIQGKVSVCEGSSNSVSYASGAHAEGDHTVASGQGSHAEGSNTKASGNYSHAGGSYTTASGIGSHTEGNYTTASGDYSHAEGKASSASAIASHAEGSSSYASGEASHVEGKASSASAIASHAEGSSSYASAIAAHAEGYSTIAGGDSQIKHIKFPLNEFIKVDSYSGEGSNIAINTTSNRSTDLWVPGYRTSQTADAFFRSITRQSTDDSSTYPHKERNAYLISLQNNTLKKASAAYRTDLNSHFSTNNNYNFYGFNNLINFGGYIDWSQSHSYVSSVGIKNIRGIFEKVASSIVIELDNTKYFTTGVFCNIVSGSLGGTPEQPTANASNGDLMFSNRNTTLNTAMTSAKTNGALYLSPREDSDFIVFREDGQKIDVETFQTLFGAAETKYFYVDNYDRLLQKPTSAIGEGYLTVDDILNYLNSYGSASDYEVSNDPAGYSHAEGSGTEASGQGSHAEGRNTKSYGVYSHAEGNSAIAYGESSHAEGYGTSASGKTSHAEGGNTLAAGGYSHAEGYGGTSAGPYSHVEGYVNSASGEASHAEGYGTIVSASYSHAEGYGTSASGEASHAEGQFAEASGSYSHAEGSHTRAVGRNSHAEGYSASAVGPYSHAEGNTSVAGGTGSHAEGDSVAHGRYSHAEGQHAVASGSYSHAEGYNTLASGSYSHAEGTGSIALGEGSHAEGTKSKLNKSNPPGNSFIQTLWTEAINRNSPSVTSGFNFNLENYINDCPGVGYTIGRGLIDNEYDDQAQHGSSGYLIKPQSFTNSSPSGRIWVIIPFTNPFSGSNSNWGNSNIFLNATEVTLTFYQVMYHVGNYDDNTPKFIYDAPYWDNHPKLTRVRYFSHSITNAKIEQIKGFTNNGIDYIALKLDKNWGSLEKASSSMNSDETENPSLGSYNWKDLCLCALSIDTAPSRANGNYSHIEGHGCNTSDEAEASHAEGYMTETTNAGEHACGILNESGHVIQSSGIYTVSTGSTAETGSRIIFSVGVGNPENGYRQNGLMVTQNGDVYILKNPATDARGSATYKKLSKT